MSDAGRGKRRRRGDRGVFERPKASGVWWARYCDENGRLHRERVGPKGLAQKVYQKRKNEVQERRFFPERIGRRDVLLAEMIDEGQAKISIDAFAVDRFARSRPDQERLTGEFDAALASAALAAQAVS